MNVTKEQLTGIVEMCWAAACEAKIPIGPMVIQQTDGQPMRDQFGLPLLNTQRLGIFQNMVACLTPKHQANTVENIGPKEPWEG